MIVKLDTSQRPPWKCGDPDAPELRIDLDENYDPPLEEPWNTYYGDRDWKEYYDFNEDELYIVLSVSGAKVERQHIRLTGRLNDRPISPFLYPPNMFIIVEETLPEDWVILAQPFTQEKGVPIRTVGVPIRELNIYTYSDMLAYAETHHLSSLGTYPQEFGLYAYGDYLENKRQMKERMKPYLEQILAQQTALNRKVN